MEHEVGMSKHSSRKLPDELEKSEQIQANEAIGTQNWTVSNLKGRKVIPDAASFNLVKNYYMVNHIP